MRSLQKVRIAKMKITFLPVLKATKIKPLEMTTEKAVISVVNDPCTAKQEWGIPSQYMRIGRKGIPCLPTLLPK